MSDGISKGLPAQCDLASKNRKDRIFNPRVICRQQDQQHSWGLYRLRDGPSAFDPSDNRAWDRTLHRDGLQIANARKRKA